MHTRTRMACVHTRMACTHSHAWHARTHTHGRHACTRMAGMHAHAWHARTHTHGMHACTRMACTHSHAWHAHTQTHGMHTHTGMACAHAHAWHAHQGGGSKNVYCCTAATAAYRQKVRPILSKGEAHPLKGVRPILSLKSEAHCPATACYSKRASDPRPAWNHCPGSSTNCTVASRAASTPVVMVSRILATRMWPRPSMSAAQGDARARQVKRRAATRVSSHGFWTLPGCGAGGEGEVGGLGHGLCTLPGWGRGGEAGGGLWALHIAGLCVCGGEVEWGGVGLWFQHIAACMCTSACACMCTSACACMCTSASACMCKSASACMCTSACACMCIPVCACMQTPPPPPPHTPCPPDPPPNLCAVV